MKHVFVLLAGLTVFLSEPIDIYGQHALPSGNGVTMYIDVMGAENSVEGESGNTVIYTSKHNYISTSINVEVDWTSMDFPCDYGDWYSSMMTITINALAVTGYNPDGSVASTVVTNSVTVSGSNKDGSLRASLSDGGYPNAVYSVYFWTNGDCATIEDSTRTKVISFDHLVTVRPSATMALLADELEGRTGRDPFDNSDSDWFPSIDEMDLGQEMPGDDYTAQEENEFGGCSSYGRPQYGVNMRFLAPGILDREYYQPGPGPAIDVTRLLSPLHHGIFGKGWRSTLEILARTKPVKDSFSGPVTIEPSRGDHLYFDYDPVTALMTAVNSSDTAYFSDENLVWIDRDRKLINTFKRAPDTSFYYIETISDYFNNKITFAYDEPGRVSSVTDDAGRSVNFEYNNNNYVETFTTPDGREAHFDYNDSSRLMHSIDLEGYESEFAYDTLNNITELTFDGKTTGFEYTDQAGRAFLSALTDALGNRYIYDLNLWNNFAIGSVTDPNGNKTTWHYDGYGNITMIENGNSLIVYEYDEQNRMTEKRFPNGDNKTYEYDDKGRPARITYNNSDEELYTWNADNTLKSYTDREGNTEQYEYDNGQLTRYTDASGNSSQLFYNPSGRISRLLRADQTNLYYTYDEFGNLVNIADDNGLLASISYDASGLFIQSVTDAGGNTTQYAFDNNNRLKSVSMPDGSVVSQNFGCCGLETMTDENNNTVGFSRDALNSITSLVLPDNSRLDFDYNAAHYLSEIKNSNGDSYTIQYNNRNMPVKMVNFNGDSVRYEYNDNNQIVSLKDERGNQTSFTWINNYLYSVTDAMNRTRSYNRDRNDRIIKSNNARPSSAVEYEYNPKGLVVSKNTSSRSYSFGYDKMGRMIREKSGNDSARYTYNSRGHLLSITWQNGNAVDFEPNETGRTKTITYPDGYSVQYNYNSGNKLALLKTPDDSVEFIYDDAGKLVSEIRSNETTTQQSFDDYGRIRGILHKKNADTLINLTYDYDERGNIASGTVDFPYDLSFTGFSNYEANYNTLNQVISENGNDYAYDHDGNLTKIDGNRDFAAGYTDENLIDSMIIGGQTLKYEYNGLMQAVKVIVNDQEFHLYYDLDDRLLFETDASNNILIKYIYAGHRLVTLVDADDKLHFYHYDRTGNTLALTNTNGEISNAYWYTPSGEKVISQGAVKNRFTYLGAWNVSDENNGFYRMGLRVYDAHLGRFIQRDPKGFVDGTNLYAYGYNNPLLHLDPKGADVANGTADLFTCQGPVYGDDFISPETARVISETVNLTTDLAPGISDVKGSAKLLYYLYEGDHKKAAMEAISMAGGKYLGGKLGPEILTTMGSKITEEVAETVADITANGVFKVLGDTAENMMEDPPSNNATKKAAPSYEMGPPVGVQF